MKKLIHKISYMLKTGYNPYPLYWYDLLTERYLKDRIGECTNCIQCCRYICGSCQECYCIYTDRQNLRCTIYDHRKCNIWFPVSQKEIDYRAKIQPGFKCRFIFNKKI